MKIILTLIILLFTTFLYADEFDYQPQIFSNDYDTSPVLEFQEAINDMDYDKVVREELRRQEYTLRPYGENDTYYNGVKDE